MGNNLSVSVVVPLYNAEKYIADCLESILAQTFKDFEVIVVDDCSTDNSCAIVESYIPKFDGQLALYHMEKNSGSGALPRNKGIILSQGEYIVFADADDMITPTALEELYTLAKNYEAEVVYCEKHYKINDDGSGIHIGTGADQNVKLVDKPTFETENLTERVQKILQGKYRIPQWRKFVRRDFIFKYEIFFPHCKISEDDIWTYALVFYAKKFLRVPNVTYIYRLSETSIKLTPKTPQQVISFWLNPIFFGLKTLDNFMSKLEFFQANLQWRYAVLENFVCSRFSCALQSSFQLSSSEIYETLQQTFGENFGEHDVLISALCTILIAQQKISVINQEKLNQIVAQNQARIAELEKINRENVAYISELEKFIAESQRN
ncbi:MAG: glycosyltransferase [Selenomonadaceae bacterium]|nr:glycosyltransferase [Selenomonadaceae bacterium]